MIHSPCLFINSLTPVTVPPKSVMACAITHLLCFKNDIFLWTEKTDCFCSLLSSSSPLLVGQSHMQYAYRDSLYFSLASLTFPLVFSIHVSLSWLQSGTKCLFVVLLPCYSKYCSTFHTFAPSIWTAWYNDHPAILLLTPLYCKQISKLQF